MGEGRGVGTELVDYGEGRGKERRWEYKGVYKGEEGKGKLLRKGISFGVH